MSDHQQQVLLGQPIHYTLPADLRFECLGRSQGAEIVRLRFARGDITIMDIPLSAETVVALADTLTALAGTIPQDVKRKLEELHSQGLRLNP